MALRVLVTGAAGFTGRYVVRALLQHGHEAWGVEPREVPDSPCPITACDLLEDHAPLIGTFREFQPTHILHLAALSHVTAAAPGAHYLVNTIGTERLLRTISAHGRDVTRVLLASTGTIYGNSTDPLLSERHPVSPQNHYAFSKLVMEQIALNWFPKLPVCIARPFNYTGVGQSTAFLVPKIVRHFADRAAVIRLGNLDVARDLSDVRYVADVYRRLLEAPTEFQVVNICSERSVPLRSIITDMRDISNHDLRVEVDPGLVRSNEIAELKGDATHLAQVLGRIEPPPFRDTLTWMYQEAVAGRG
jgi:GDP-6-deoxy-D-talose 4-dehydrogenase